MQVDPDQQTRNWPALLWAPQFRHQAWLAGAFYGHCRLCAFCVYGGSRNSCGAVPSSTGRSKHANIAAHFSYSSSLKSTSVFSINSRLHAGQRAGSLKT
jgi:hypothetical protein